MAGPFGADEYMEDQKVDLSALSYSASGVRTQPIKEELARELRQAVTAVYGPDYRVDIMSAAQPSGPKGTKGTTGTRRHGTGVAADVWVYAPDGRRLAGDDLVPLSQHWLATKKGSVGFPARAGQSLHLDLIGGKGPGAVPRQKNEGALWYYGSPSQSQRSALNSAVSKGTTPKYAISPDAVAKGYVPPGSIPDVASLTSTAPTPQVISASLGDARSNPPPLPRRPPTTAAPQTTYDRSWMADYGRIIDQAQPQRPTGQASLGPQPRTPAPRPISSWQNMPRLTAPQPVGGVASRRVASVPVSSDAFAGQSLKYYPQRGESLNSPPLVPPSLNPISPMSARQMREPANPTRTVMVRNPEYDRQAQQIIKAVPLDQTVRLDKYGVPTGQVGFGSTPPLPRPRPNVPEFIPKTVPAPAQPAPIPMPHTGAIKARANNPMLALPETEAERMFKASQFGLPPLPRARPQVAPIPMPFGARPGMRAPQPMAYGMRPQSRSPVQITVGSGMRAPQPRPHYEAAIARNGYVYAPSSSGGAPTRVGSARPSGMTPSQQYDAAAARARQSSPGNESGVSWW